MPFYLEAGDLAGGWLRGKNWTGDLCGAPSAFDRDLLDMLEAYLRSTQGKEFDGESLRSFKSLREIVRRKTRPRHSVLPAVAPERRGGDGGKSALFQLRCKCFPLQDTTKQPFRVVVCLDSRAGVPYGAHSRCVSGKYEAPLRVFFLHLTIAVERSQQASSLLCGNRQLWSLSTRTEVRQKIHLTTDLYHYYPPLVKLSTKSRVSAY